MIVTTCLSLNSGVNYITRENRSTCGLICGKFHMWTPHANRYSTCGFRIWSYTEPYMIIELNNMWTPYTEIIYGNHMRKSYAENHMWFTVYDFDVCIWFQRKPHVDSIYGKSYAVNHVWTPLLHIWTSYVNSTYEHHMWTSHVNSKS